MTYASPQLLNINDIKYIIANQFSIMNISCLPRFAQGITIDGLSQLL